MQSWAGSTSKSKLYLSRHDTPHDHMCTQALLSHTKAVLSKALCIWPSAAVRVNYINKLLQNNAHHNLDPPPTLLTGLDVMETLVELQPQKMVRECGAELILMLDPCFASKHHQVSRHLGKVLVKLYQALGEPRTDNTNHQLMVSCCNCLSINGFGEQCTTVHAPSGGTAPGAGPCQACFRCKGTCPLRQYNSWGPTFVKLKPASGQPRTHNASICWSICF